MPAGDGEPPASKRARVQGTDAAEDDGHEAGDALLDGAHPYGVKPEGNFLQDGADGRQRANVLATSLGALRRLNDAAVLAILARLPATVLCCLSATSRGLYVFSHHANLWRDLTIGEYGGDFKYDDGGWKQTYICRSRPASKVRHMPLRVDGCYSDTMYNPWMNSALQIDPSWLKVDNVDRRAGLSPEDFILHYETPGVPVILTDVMDAWLAKTGKLQHECPLALAEALVIHSHAAGCKCALDPSVWQNGTRNACERSTPTQSSACRPCWT